MSLIKIIIADIKMVMMTPQIQTVRWVLIKNRGFTYFVAIQDIRELEEIQDTSEEHSLPLEIEFAEAHEFHKYWRDNREDICTGDAVEYVRMAFMKEIKQYA